MPRPRVYNSPAIVLRQRKLGDADKIITLYSAIARQARRRREGRAPLAQQARRPRRAAVPRHVPARAGPKPRHRHPGRDHRALRRAPRRSRPHEPRPLRLRATRPLHRAPPTSTSTSTACLLDTLRRIAARDDHRHAASATSRCACSTSSATAPSSTTCVTCREPLAAVTNYWTAGGGGVACPNCRRDEATVRPISVERREGPPPPPARAPGTTSLVSPSTPTSPSNSSARSSNTSAGSSSAMSARPPSSTPSAAPASPAPAPLPQSPMTEARLASNR